MEKFGGFHNENDQSSKNAENAQKKESILRSLGKKAVLVAGLTIGTAGFAKAQNQENISKPAEKNRTEISVDSSRSERIIEEALKFYRQEREWLIKTIQSPEYKRRLMENEGLSAEVADQRVESLLSTHLDIKQELLLFVASDSLGQIIGRFMWDPYYKKIELPPIGYETRNNFGLITHEGAHASVEGDINNMSEYANGLYKEAFILSPEEVQELDSLINLPGVIYDSLKNTLSIEPNAPTQTKEAYNQYFGLIEYYSDPLELDARKKVLEYEMDILGIKKYSETFTEENLLDLYDQYESLSPNSQEFLDHIDRSYFLTIMNTIASFKTTVEKQTSV